jgi:hypothetical protein
MSRLCLVILLPLSAAIFAAEYVASKPPPAAKKKTFGRPYFLFGGIMMAAFAITVTIYSKFLKPGR